MNAAALWKNAGLKARKRRAYWITVLSLCGLLTVSFGGQWYTARQSDEFVFALPSAWPGILSGSILVAGLFGSVIVILLVASEFSWRTARQNVIDGLSKAEFFVEKLIQIPLVAVPILVAIIIIGGAFALAGTESGADVTLIRAPDLLLMGGALLALVGYLSLALFFALLIRSAGAAMGVLLLYMVAIENLIGGALAWIDESLATAARYFPTQIFDALVQIEQYDSSMRERARQMALEAGQTPTDPVATPLLIAIALTYILILLGVSYVIFERRDL